MVTASIYQQFLQAVWQRFRRDYPYVKRFSEASPLSMPKRSSFLIGRSPIYDKYLALHFQYNTKQWGAGQLTINVAIFREFSQIDSLPHFQDYSLAEDGTYRLGAECHGYDIWWCLKDRDRSFDAQMQEILRNFDPGQQDRKFFDGKWRPSSFDDSAKVIDEALDDIFPMIDRELLARFGFPPRQTMEERDFTDTDLTL